jgi:hypothetical protein
MTLTYAVGTTGTIRRQMFHRRRTIAHAIQFLCLLSWNWIADTTRDVNGGMLME